MPSKPSEKTGRVYSVDFVYSVHGNIQIEAETEAEAEQIVRELPVTELEFNSTCADLDVLEVRDLE